MATFEELAWTRSPFGELVLRRREIPGLDAGPIHEITVDGEMLMSSWLDASERALAQHTLAVVAGEALEVVVGGLGLGRTAQAVLEDPRVAHVHVVEIVPEVVAWHRDGLVPWGPALVADPRVHVHVADFFAWIEAPAGDVGAPAHPHAVLVDIDHRPDALLDPRNARFQGRASLARLARRLAAGGAFGFWSAGPPQDAFLERIATAFAHVTAHAIRVDNPMIDAEQVDTVYVARP
ncbi:MAG: spermidine synthase [Planctomycetota bacterium]